MINYAGDDVNVGRQWAGVNKGGAVVMIDGGDNDGEWSTVNALNKGELVRFRVEVN
jgi:hypothetical protein